MWGMGGRSHKDNQRTAAAKGVQSAKREVQIHVYGWWAPAEPSTAQAQNPNKTHNYAIHDLPDNQGWSD